MNHWQGKLEYVNYYKKYAKLDEKLTVNEVINIWKKDFSNHLKNVEQYFIHKNNLFVYDLDKNKLKDLQNFIPKLIIPENTVHIGKCELKKKWRYTMRFFFYI